MIRESISTENDLESHINLLYYYILIFLSKFYIIVRYIYWTFLKICIIHWTKKKLKMQTEMI